MNLWGFKKSKTKNFFLTICKGKANLHKTQIQFILGIKMTVISKKRYIFGNLKIKVIFYGGFV